MSYDLNYWKNKAEEMCALAAQRNLRIIDLENQLKKVLPKPKFKFGEIALYQGVTPVHINSGAIVGEKGWEYTTLTGGVVYEVNLRKQTSVEKGEGF